MKSKILVGLGAAVCISLATFSAAAKDDKADVPDLKLSQFTLGDHVSGEKVDLSKMEGKVVAIEYWGTR